MALNEFGHEVLDPTPAAVPLNWKRPMALADQIRLMVRNELSQSAVSQGHESFEEADDFNVGDDYDPKSNWELNYDQENYVPDKDGMPEETVLVPKAEPAPKGELVEPSEVVAGKA